jgi:hypothetical protein
MARTFLHHQKAGLQQFILKDGFSSVGLADVSDIQIDVGAVTVFSTAHDSGPVRWNTSETRMGEIMALVPMVSFTENNAPATVVIDGPTYPPGGITYGPKTIAVGEGSFMAAAGTYYDQCDGCGIWFPVEQLIRQLKIREVRPAANYLPWSRFNNEGWQVDTDELGEVSMGRSRWFHKIHPYAGSMVAGGAGSFWGDGLLVSNDTIDVAAFSTALLSGIFGTHQTTKKPFLDIEFGVYYDYGGGSETKYVFGTGSGVDGKRVWAVNDLSGVDGGHVGALQPYFDVTTHDDQQIWWAESLRVQKDVLQPGMTTVETKGVARIKEFNAAFLGSGVACEECYDVLKKRVNEYRPTVDQFEIVDVEDQEL